MPVTSPHFILLHAPLVGPFTWSLVASALRKKGCPVTLPVLTLPKTGGKLYWQQHVEDVTAAVNRSAAAGHPLVLVAHSGAGPLLPPLHQALNSPVAADIFVDALYPQDGKSRLDLIAQAEGSQMAEDFRRSASGDLLPVWTEEDLEAVISDAAVRRGFVEELSPLPLAVYEESIPVQPGWPDAPAAYLRFGENPAYDGSFQRARQAGFTLHQMDGQHFEMLEHPARVAEALVALIRELGIPVEEEHPNA